MSTGLPPDFENYVIQAVAAGQYASPEAAVQKAFRLLKDHDQDLQKLRRDVRAGFDQLDRGEGTEYDDEGLDALIDKIQLEYVQRLGATNRQ
jgi:putative addiction module CopG family antidote